MTLIQRRLNVDVTCTRRVPTAWVGMCLYQQPGSSCLIGWKLEVGVAS